jgi:hypothetical protein
MLIMQTTFNRLTNISLLPTLAMLHQYMAALLNPPPPTTLTLLNPQQHHQNSVPLLPINAMLPYATSLNYTTLICSRVATLRNLPNTPTLQTLTPLTTPSISLSTSSGTSIGRPALLSHLNSPSHFHTPPTLIIVENATAALLYYIQHGASADYLAASFLLFTGPTALLDRVATVTCTSTAAPQPCPYIPPLSNPPTPPSYCESVKRIASALTANFNAQQTILSRSLIASTAVLQSKSSTLVGKNAVLAHIDRYLGLVPDILVHDEHVVAEGRWVAVQLVMQGMLPGKVVRTRGARFLEFARERVARGVEVVRWVECLNEGNLVGG